MSKPLAPIPNDFINGNTSLPNNASRICVPDAATIASSSPNAANTLSNPCLNLAAKPTFTDSILSLSLVFNNAITDALATNETQGEFVNRIRNGIEGLAFGGVIEVFGKAFRAAKATKNAKEEFIKTGEVSIPARKEMDDAIDDLKNLDLEGSPKKEDIKKV